MRRNELPGAKVSAVARKHGIVTGLLFRRRALFGIAQKKRSKLARVVKYCDRLPLCRQSQIFDRHGVGLCRSTLAGWVGGACWWLEALPERLCKNVFASNHLFC